jgi:ATP synthase F1 epsilon subunit
MTCLLPLHRDGSEARRRSESTLFFFFMSLQISILTPEKPFWNGEAEEIILPTETGEMGVLKNHAPIITGLDVGAMLVRTKEEWNSYALMGGFAVVKNIK